MGRRCQVVLVAAVALVGVARGSVSANDEGSPSPSSAGTARLAVPYVAQTEALCGGAAVSMVAHYWGHRDIHAADFAPLINEQLHGIQVDDLTQAVERRGWSAWAFSGDRALVTHHLRHRRPLFALLENRPGRLHYVVVVAWEDAGVVIHDPAAGPNRVVHPYPRSVITDVMGLSPPDLLVDAQLRHARRRLAALPSVASTRIAYRPSASGHADVDVRVQERPLIVDGAGDAMWLLGRTAIEQHGRLAVAAKLVRDQSARDIALAFQQLPEESHRCATISTRVHEDIEHVAILVHRPPEVLQATVERDEEFVEMPRVTLLPAPVPQRASVGRPERQAPLTDRLVGDGDAPLGQQVFDIPEAEREPTIQPHRMADDLRRESVAAIARCLAAHPPTVPLERST